MNITVIYKDGTKENFPETSRAGGSWCTHYKLEAGWIVIIDAYGSETIIPESNVEKIETQSPRGW